VGGDLVLTQGSETAGSKRNGTGWRTHRRRVDGTQRKRGSESREGLVGRLGDIWRRLRPLPPEQTRACLARLHRRLGERLHLKVYLDALQEQVVRLRTAAKKPQPQQGGSPP
jgi:hypothetical protein